jgi:hypothetical protein
MDPALAKLLWLVALMGVFIGIGLMLLRLDKSEAWSKAHVAQLFLNKHGGLDLAAVMLWINMAVDVLVIVFCLFKGNVPDRMDIIMAAFNATFAAPIIAKILKGATDSQPVKETP